MNTQIISFVCLVSVSGLSFAQDDITICHVPATEQFAMLALEDGFYEEHDVPAPYVHKSQSGKIIKIPVEGGDQANVFELKASSTTSNYLFVVHEWWGLNEHIKKEAEKYFNDIGNVNVLAIDLYDGKIADNQQDAGEYMRSVKTERAVAILNAAVKYSGGDARIATIGWCFGGGWSLQTALLAGKQTVGCVIYYGMPEKDIEKLSNLNSDVLGIFASQEQWISPEIVKEFEGNMHKAGKKLTVHSFDANHAFANPSSDSYNGEAAQEANKISLAYLKEKFD